MRFATLAPVNDSVEHIQAVYGKFDLWIDGRPNVLWENRNLKLFKPVEAMRHMYFPDCWVHKFLVNKRLMVPLANVLREIHARWTREAREAHGLNQFVKCYCFGDGLGPNLHWYGGAWELSAQVGGDVLADTVEIFTRHGFKHAYTSDKKKLRTFEYW